MTKRKIILLSILFIGLLAISAVSASDNATEAIAGADDSSNEVANVVDTADAVIDVEELAVDIDNEKENNDIELNDSSSNTEDLKCNDAVLNSAEENETLSYNLDNDVLSSSPPYNAYSVSVSDITMDYGSSGSIVMSISLASSSYSYRYHFYLKVYDSSNNVKINKLYSGSSYTTIIYTISSNALSAGSYTIKIINTLDGKVMDTAKLKIISVPSYAYSVSVSDTLMYCGSSGSIVMSIYPASSYHYYKYDFYLKVYDFNNVLRISKRYYSDSSDYSKTYTIGSNKLSPGIYTIKIINNDGTVMRTAMLTVKKLDLQSQDLNRSYKDTIQYKVRASENGVYKSGLKVTFECNGIKKTVDTDSQGYATLNIHLKAGTYYIYTKCVNIAIRNTIKINKAYVPNKYKQVYIKPIKTYYGANLNIEYGWKGNIKAFFKIFKGKKLVFSQKIDTSGKVGDYFKYYPYVKYFSIQKLPAGLFYAKIIDSTRKLARKQVIKIYKSQTRVLCSSVRTTAGSNAVINVGVYGKANDGAIGIVKFTINGRYYHAKLNHGSAKISVYLPFKVKPYQCKVRYLGNKNYKPSLSSFKISVVKPKVQKQEKPVYSARLYLNVNSVNYAKAKLNTGDTLLGSANSYDRQHSKGVTIGTLIDVGQDGQHSTRLIKAKVWFINLGDDSEISVVQSAESDGYNIEKIDWIDGYIPYKAQVWYQQR